MQHCCHVRAYDSYVCPLLAPKDSRSGAVAWDMLSSLICFLPEKRTAQLHPPRHSTMAALVAPATQGLPSTPTIPVPPQPSPHCCDSGMPGATQHTCAMQGTGQSKVRNPRFLSTTHRTDSGLTFIGRMCVTRNVLGYGSSGTVVFEGSLDGRKIAVKRTLRQVSPVLCTARELLLPSCLPLACPALHSLWAGPLASAGRGIWVL